MLATEAREKIRIFTKEDFDQGSVLALEYYREHADRMGVMISPTAVKRLLDWFSGALPGGFAIVAQKGDILTGFICGYVGPWLFDPAITVFEEIAWFMRKEYRRGRTAIRLFNAAQDYAKQRGARMLFMSDEATGSDSVGRFYSRMGFTELERKWMKKI